MASRNPDHADAPPHKGRGATFNPANRYRREARETVDDGWSHAPDDEAADGAPPLRTVVAIQPARSIIARNDSPDVPFSQSINAYLNPVNERAMRDVLTRQAPELYVSLSSDVAPQIREYPRASTTA